VLCCAFYVVTFGISSVFLVLMSVLGGGLYVADATFKKMSWRTTQLAMCYVITEFDKDTSTIMANIVSVSQQPVSVRNNMSMCMSHAVQQRVKQVTSIPVYC
jgi:hypothetical protein